MIYFLVKFIVIRTLMSDKRLASIRTYFYIYKNKADYTEKVYHAFQTEIPELSCGKADLKWDEMWLHYTNLTNYGEFEKNQELILKDVLWSSLMIPQKNRFIRLTEDDFKKRLICR